MDLTTINNLSMGNQLTTNFAAEWSADGRIFVVTDNIVSILQLRPEMTNTENIFSFLKSEIILGNYHVANDTGINYDEIALHLSRNDLYHAILHYNLTPKLNQTNGIAVRAVAAAWAPVCCKINSQLLAILSNTGNVEIWMQKRKKWIVIANLTKYWAKHLKPSWTKTPTGDYDKAFELHKKRVIQATATCISWGKFNETNNCFYLTTGLKSGYVTIWKIYHPECNEKSDEPVLFMSYNTELQQLTSIHWHTANDNLAWIVYGDINGLVKCIPIGTRINNDVKSIDIWKHEDIAPSKIISFNFENKSCFLIIKGSFIFLTLLNQTKVDYVKFYNVGNINISGIQQIENCRYVISTMTGVLKILKIEQIKDQLECVFDDVKVDVKWDYHACHGILKSPTGIIWAILMHPCKIIDHLLIRSAIQIVFCTTEKFDPGKHLIMNFTRRLENIWECLEIIRCISAKNNTLPCTWLAQVEDYGKLSFYELRIFYWISVICQAFVKRKIKCKKLRSFLPAPETLRKIIFLKYRIKKLKALLDKHEHSRALSNFQLSSIYLLNDAISTSRYEDFFTEYFKENTNSEIHWINKRVLNIDIKIPKCRWCDNNLSSKSCTGNHPEFRCILSGAQIFGISKWECVSCGLPAHEEIQRCDAICPICDISMDSNY